MIYSTVFYFAAIRLIMICSTQVSLNSPWSFHIISLFLSLGSSWILLSVSEIFFYNSHTISLHPRRGPHFIILFIFFHTPTRLCISPDKIQREKEEVDTAYSRRRQIQSCLHHRSWTWPPTAYRSVDCRCCYPSRRPWTRGERAFLIMIEAASVSGSQSWTS